MAASLQPIPLAQLVTYLRLTRLELGLLLNLNVALMKDGIRRIVRGGRSGKRESLSSLTLLLHDFFASGEFLNVLERRFRARRP